MKPEDIDRLVGIDHVGWTGIVHKEGWWLGDERGVITYRDYHLAFISLTLVRERDPERADGYSLQTFNGLPAKEGLPPITPARTLDQAFESLEKKVKEHAKKKTQRNKPD